MKYRKSVIVTLFIIFSAREYFAKTPSGKDTIIESQAKKSIHSQVASRKEVEEIGLKEPSILKSVEQELNKPEDMNASKMLGDKLKEGHDANAEPGMNIGWIPRVEPKKIIAFGIYIFLTLTGVYVALFGFRVFRLLMIILGFYVSYYGILFALTELKIYNSNDIGHQMGLFFGCIILGFIISIMCYMLDKINFVIFGMAIASVISLFAAQFLINFKLQEDRVLLLVIYLASTVIFSAMAFFILDHFIIWGSAFVGSVITPINIGVIFGDFKSFEDREKIPVDRWKDFLVYLLVCGLMFITGLGIQYHLRRRIIKRMQDSNLEEIRGTSFLN